MCFVLIFTIKKIYCRFVVPSGQWSEMHWHHGGAEWAKTTAAHKDTLSITHKWGTRSSCQVPSAIYQV